MARELGLSPKRFAKYADRENQPWKLPLTKFIEAQYLKQFGKERPDEVKPMEEIAAAHVAKRAARKVANANTESDAESSAVKASTPAVAENATRRLTRQLLTRQLLTKQLPAKPKHQPHLRLR